MTFQEFKKEWEESIHPAMPKFIRKGQSLMNYLSKIWQEESIRMSSVHYYDETDIDCYYNDKLIDNTLKHLEKVWKEHYPN